MTNPSRTRAITSRAAILTALAVLAALFTAPLTAPASADPPYATDATITDIAFTQSTVQEGKEARLDVSWTLPDNPETPAGFVVDLPPELQGTNDSFPLTAPDGSTMGTCKVTRTQLICDFDDAYLQENPRNLSGDVFFWVTVKENVTEDTEMTYQIEDFETSITVTPTPGWEEFPGWLPTKYGEPNWEDKTIRWVIQVPAPVDGMKGGEQVTVTENLGPDQTIRSMKVMQANQIGTDPNGNPAPVNWSEDTSAVVTPPTATFTSKAGYFYTVEIVADITDLRPGSYTNTAQVEIEGQETITLEGEVIRQGGGGTGSGDNVGRFSITKKVDGVDGLTTDFTGSYTVTPATGDPIEGTFSVNDGETWTSPEYPRNATVTVTEVQPTAPANVTWGAPIWSEDEFTIAGGTTVPVMLTNPAQLKTGNFAIRKVLQGSPDVVDLVPDSTTFKARYSYPAGTGFPAGSGTLRFKADGDFVTSPELPTSAKVTVREVDLPKVPGVTWGTPKIKPSTFTVGDDTVVDVTVTNPVSVTKHRPKITTIASHQRATPGTVLHDRVKISGFKRGGDAVGTATLWGPTTKASDKMCRPGTKVRTVTFDPRNGTVRTPGIKVKRAGYYTWTAKISGDKFNKAVSHGCGYAKETTTVAKRPYQPPVVDTGYTVGAPAQARRAGSDLVYPQLGIRAPASKVAIRKGHVVVPTDIHRVGLIRKSGRAGDLIGTAAYVGHVSDRHDSPGVFWRLKQARRGDVIRAKAPDGSMVRYTVTSVKRYDRTKQLPKRAFATTGKPQITLISCTNRISYPGGGFHYLDNIVVTAKLKR